MKELTIILSIIVALICVQVGKNAIDNNNLQVEYGATIDQLNEAVAQLEAERVIDKSKITSIPNPFLSGRYQSDEEDTEANQK